MRFLPVVLVLLCACASRGFDHGLLRREMQIAEQPVVTDADIASALARKPQLAEGFRVGIYFREPEERQSWRWTAADRARVLDAVSAADGVGEAFLVSPLVVARQDLRSIRLAAAQHGADALIVVAGGADVDVSANAWAVAYLAVVPLLFAPGNDMDALFIARAAMWDVRNEFLYVTADGESARSQKRPAAFIERRKALIDSTRSEAIDQLAQELSRRLQRLAGTPGRALRPLQLRSKSAMPAEESRDLTGGAPCSRFAPRSRSKEGSDAKVVAGCSDSRLFPHRSSGERRDWQSAAEAGRRSDRGVREGPRRPAEPAVRQLSPGG